MIDDDQLLSSALGEPIDTVEDHVLACTRCADRYAAFLRLGPAIASLIRGAEIRLAVTPSLVAALEAQGLITRRYALVPGGSVACTVGAADIFTLATFAADFTGVTRVDLVSPEGRFTDVPFDRATGIVYTITNAAVLKPLPTLSIPFSLVADDGRVLGSYTMNHTAFAP